MSRPAPRVGEVDELLEEAAEVSRHFGRDAQFSRAGGGNSSVKADRVLYIKPSGVSLASLTADALMPLDMAPLLELIEGTPDALRSAGSETVMQVAMAARLRPDGQRRPSVECLFHALIPRRFVLHTHPTIVNALCCARDAARVAERLFGDAALWVPYVDPGLPLARAISEARRQFERRTGREAPDIVLLQNHGLIVAADDVSTIANASAEVVETIRPHLNRVRRAASSSSTPAPQSLSRPTSQTLIATLGPLLRAALATGTRLKVVGFDDSAAAVELAGTSDGRSLLLGGPLLPDQIVYTGSWPLWLDPPSIEDEPHFIQAVRGALADHIRSVGAAPTIIVVSGLGL
ncbi:MAG: class II aldolase/adducin family protein, partial [Chloroflexota bacterium]|nr:class II aldolase/adducin family protein [Chloroflexota bacterium]